MFKKIFYLNLIFTFGCLNQIEVSLKDKVKKNLEQQFNPTITNVKIQNSQLIISGNNLSKVTKIKIKNSSGINEDFNIESSSTNQLIANGQKVISVALNSAFDLILSNAVASASFAVDFSLCNGTLNTKAIDCSVAVSDKDVLSYDAASGKWKPRPINGLNYIGLWDATSGANPGVQPSGSYYIIGVAGTMGSGTVTLHVGDWIVSTGTLWQKIDNSVVITSVFGRTGAVVAQKGDYNLDKLADVDLSSGLAPGKVLKYDGTNWVPGTVSAGGGGTVTTVSASAPISVTNGSTTPAITISQATTSTNGYLSSADWNSFNNKEDAIAPQATTKYFRGDKTFVTLDTSVVPENTNLYFTNARVLGVPLTGITVTNSAVSATDSVLSAFGKLQGQIDNISTGSADFLIKNSVDTVTGQVTIHATTGSLKIPTTPSGVDLTEAANVQYVKNYADNKVAKAGDTMSGDLTLDTQAKFKSGSYYTTVKGSGAAIGNYVLTLPPSAGSNGYILTTNGSGVTTWTNPASISAGTSTVDSAAIVDGTIVDADISGTAAIAQSKISGLTTALAAKEGTVTAGTTAQYYRGDKSWQTLNSDAVPEGATNLYYTNARVLGLALTGINTTTSGTIAATDSVLTAFGKTQKQIDDINLTVTGMAGAQWSSGSGNVYRSTGNVGIATNSPTEKLHVVGNALLSGSVKLQDSTTNTISVKAPTTVTSYTMTLPAAAGTNGQILSTTGSGNMAWTSLPTCNTGEVLKSNGTSFSCVTDVTGAGAFTGTASRAVATDSGGALTTTTVTATELGYVSGVTSAIQTQLNGKEPSITAGTTAQYLRGDKTLSTFATDAINSVLSTYTVGTNTSVANTDSIVGAVGKLQGQINAHTTAMGTKADLTNVTQTITALGVTGLAAPTAGSDAANKTYVDNSISATGVWTKSASDVYRSTGNVGIATSTPSEKLHVVGNALVSGSVKLQDSTTNTISVKAPTTVTSYTMTLPAAAGTNGQVLSTTGSGNMTWASLPAAFSGTASRAVATDAGGALTTTTVTATELGYVSGVTSAIQTQLNGKEPTITAGTTAQYLRGDKTLSTFATDAINSVLSTYTVGTNTAVANTDSIVAAVGKLQGQINAHTTAMGTKADLTNVTQTITALAVTGLGAPSAGSDAANKTYVDNLISATGVWTKSGTDVYRSTGNVGIGTSTPSNKLVVSGLNEDVFSSIENTDNSTGYSTKMQITDYGGSGAVGLWIQNAGGTKASPTATTSGTILGRLWYSGYATGFRPAAGINVTAQQNFTSSNTPTNMLFYTTAIGSSTALERIRIDNAGNLGIATSTPSEKLHVVGNALLSGSVKLQDSTTNTISVKAPTTVTSYTMTLPAAAGTNGQILSTTGSGNMAWTSLPTCNAGEVLKSNGTSFSCVTDNTGAGAFTGTASRAVATDAGGALTTTTVTATELGYVSGVTSAIQTQLNGKEPSITAGTTAQYLRGDKTLSTFATDAINSVLSTYVLGANSSVTNADSIVGAIGKLQKQITMKADTTNVTQTITALAVTGLGAPSAGSDATNKTYVDGLIASSGSKWTLTGGDIYRATGNVGIGTTSPAYPLHVDASANAFKQIAFQNTNTGANAIIGISAMSDAGNSTIGMRSVAAGASGYVSAGGTGGLELMAANAGGDIKLLTGGFNERVRILSSGNLGINTTAPSEKLHVVGNALLSGSVKLQDSTTNTISVKAPTTVTSYTMTLPAAAGTNGQVLSTTGSGNMTWTNLPAAFSGTASRAVATDAGGALTTTTVTATELGYVSGVTSAIQTQLNGKEPTITAGTTAQYLRGDKTLSTFATDVINSVLSTYVLGANSAISNADTVVGAFGKVQKQITMKADTTNVTQTITALAVTGLGAPSAGSDATNKTYVDGLIASAGSKWTLNGSDIYRNTGNVGIGTTTPTAKLEVQGQIVSKANTIASGATVDFSTGNTQFLTSVGGSTITLSNMVDGGHYTVVVNDTTSRQYTFSGCTTVYFSPANGNTTFRTIYSILKGPSACYVTWNTGFN